MPQGMIAKDVTTTIKDGGSFIDIECLMDERHIETFKRGDILAVKGTSLLFLYAGTVKDFRGIFDKDYIDDAIVYDAVYYSNVEGCSMIVKTDVGVGRLSDGKLRHATYEEKAKFRRELLKKGYIWDNECGQMRELKPFDILRIDTDIENFNRRYMICLVPRDFRQLCDENFLAPFNCANVNLSGDFSTQCGIKCLVDVRIANEREREELANAIRQYIVKH